MSDSRRDQIQRERERLERDLAEFAQRHPGSELASRVSPGPDREADPLVDQLIDGVALLNADLTAQLEHSQDAIADALTAMVQPHLTRAIPSFTVVALRADEASGERTTPLRFPAHTELLSRAVAVPDHPQSQERCVFRTTEAVQVWPIEVEALRLVRTEASRELNGAPQTARLEVDLARTGSAGGFDALEELTELRFFLQGPHAAALQEALCHRLEAIEVWEEAGFEALHELDAQGRITMPGFDEGDAVLPQDRVTPPQFRLLTEWFLCPQRFSFLDLKLPQGWQSGLTQSRARLTFRLRDIPQHLHLEAEAGNAVRTLRLGCVPAINLFPVHTPPTPILLSATSGEALVAPDPEAAGAREVYSVDRVTLDDPGAAEAEPLAPLHSLRRAHDHRGPWWQTRSRPSLRGDQVECWLSLVEPGRSPRSRVEQSLLVWTHCTNADLPRAFRRGGGDPEFRLREGPHAASVQVETLVTPTPPLRPSSSPDRAWRLLSQLRSERLPIRDDGDASALRELLSLPLASFDGANARLRDAANLQVRALREATAAADTTLLRTPHGDAPCRGTRITLSIDTANSGVPELWAWGSILDVFFGHYATLNSFTRLVFKSADDGTELLRWPPRSGTRALI